MAVSADELEINKFFRTLQKKYQEKYNKALNKNWIICVPCQNSLNGVQLSSEFYDFHILKPSPFFKSHYVPTGSEQNHSFEILEKYIKGTSGTVKILLEEIHYNKDDKPCRILVIQHPLNMPSSNKYDISSTNSSDSSFFKSDIQPSNYAKILRFFEKDMASLNKRIEQFRASYVFLPNFLHDVANKLQEILEWAEKVFIESGNACSLNDTNYSNSELKAALEFYIINQVHDRLFPVIQKKFHEDDAEISKKLSVLHGKKITPDQFGVSETFCCPTPSAVVELASLNIKHSPIEKLLSLVTTLECLNQDVSKAVQDNFCPTLFNKGIPYITTDDLIPLLAYVIVQARPSYLVSNLYYIQNFIWSLSTSDKFSFCLVSFQAAKEYLKDVNISLLKPSTQSIKHELSLDELMVNMQNTNKGLLEKTSKPKQSVIDRKLESVTKMIEASTCELENLSCADVPEINQLDKKCPNITKSFQKKDEKLGGFLSELQQNSLGFGYGKKT